MRPSTSGRLQGVEPTIFFVCGTDGLEQGVDLTLVNDGDVRPAHVIVRLGKREVDVDLGSLPTGECMRRVYIPDLREPAQAEFVLVAEGQAQDARITPWTPQRHWEIHLVNGSHHDLGYTDLPSNVLREHDLIMDDVLRFCTDTDDWPEETRFRYVVEQGWSILHYLEHRPPEVVAELVRRIREGRIEVTAFLGNEASELCGPEEQIRLAYPCFRLKRRYGIPIETAELNDIPGISWGLATVLAGMGIRYFAPGIPDYFRWGYQVHPFWDEERVLPRDMAGAFWWEAQDGNRVLFWYSGSGVGGVMWSYEQAAASLSGQLKDLAERGYPYDLLRCRVQGGHRDNSPADVRYSLIAREWNSRWAYPRLIVGTNARFFARFEERAGGRLPVLRGELPNTDYTVGAASTGKETGINRLTHDTLLSAEKLAAVASLVSDYDYPAETLAEAYDAALLYDEHTWGMAHPLGPAQDGCWSQKSQFAYRAAALAHDVFSKSVNRIADQVRLPDEGYHLLVLNPLAQERTDVVRVPAIEAAPCGRLMVWRYPSSAAGKGAGNGLQPPMMVSGTAIGRDLVDLPHGLLAGPFELLDLSTGKSVPYQLVVLGDPLAARPLAAYRYALSDEDKVGERALVMDPAHSVELVFVAEDVPALGYKTYRLVPAAERPAFTNTLSVESNVLESRYYRVALDPATGTIVSLYDKELEREWVDAQAPHGFNQLVVRTPRTGETHLAGPSRIGECGPVYASLIVRGDGFGCPQRTQEIILYDSLKRLDLANRLLKDATPNIECYFAYPFAAEKPRFRYESSNTVMEPLRDQLPGSNTDNYAAQHWVSVRDRGGEITWSSLEAAVIELGGLWPGYTSQAHHGVTPPGYGHEFLHDPQQLEKGHLYSYALASNFRTNFQPVQVADVLFRYSITSRREGASYLPSRDFGWAVATPLNGVALHGLQEGSLSVSHSFCQVDRPNVLLLTLKAAEDGDGLIVRLVETEGQETTVTVTLPAIEITQAFRANLVEENESTLSYGRHCFRVSVSGHGIATVRCRTGRRWPTAQRMAHFD